MANALKDIDIKNQDTLALLNDELSDVTNDAFATPYMALERVRKVLGYFHIHLPAYRFLDAEEGNTVFHVDQFGEKAGFDEHGNPMDKEDSGLFLYFEWGLDESGIYTIFSEIVNEEELNNLLDAYEGDEDNEMKEDTNIDVDVPKTIMKIRTKFAKQVEANSEKDRENEMASGRPVNESKHGSPNDKGHGDAWYGRGNKNPHPKGSKEHGEYEAGYKEGQENGGKDWGSGRMGGRVNEGMRDMNSRYFKKAVADRKNVKAAAEAKEKEAKKPVKEEALHELAKDTLKSYLDKANQEYEKLSSMTDNADRRTKEYKGNWKKLEKRHRGMDAAEKRLYPDNLQEHLNLAGAKAKAKRESTTGVSHVNKLPNGKYQTTPWFSKNTVISYERRKPFYDKTMKEENLQELSDSIKRSYIAKAKEEIAEPGSINQDTKRDARRRHFLGNRIKGVEKAEKNLQELSVKALTAYRKATDKNHSRNRQKDANGKTLIFTNKAKQKRSVDMFNLAGEKIAKKLGKTWVGPKE